MVRTTLMLVLVLHVFGAAVVFAEDQGFYLGLNTGANIFNGAAENTSALGGFNLEYKPGYQGNLTLGYHLGEASIMGKGRVELEVGYRQNKVDTVEFSDGKFSAEGEATVWDLMLNTYGEHHNDTGWTPYAGAGVGVAIVNLDGVEVGGNPVVDDQDTVFAYQLGIGSTYVLSKSVKLDVGYRFFGTSSPSLTDAAGVVIKSEYQVHSLQVGLRF